MDEDFEVTPIPEDFDWDAYTRGFMLGLESQQDTAPEDTTETVEQVVYTDELELLIRNQADGAALNCALVFCIIGFLVGKELLKLWLDGLS